MPTVATLIKLLSRKSSWLVLTALWLLRNQKSRKRLALAALGTLALTVALGELLLDHRHLPWRPLNVDDRAGFATELKLRVIDMGPESWCEDFLNRSSLLQTSPVDPLARGECGWERAFELERSDETTLGGTGDYPMRCQLALGSHIWLRSLNVHAKELLGSELRQIRHYGTYSCRRINNRPTGKFSQHAYANAWDVAAFELADGRIISVLKDWDSSNAKGRFLKAAHADACRVFNVTLGPDYNQLHHDHFHVDVGPGASCR